MRNLAIFPKKYLLLKIIAFLLKECKNITQIVVFRLKEKFTILAQNFEKMSKSKISWGEGQKNWWGAGTNFRVEWIQTLRGNPLPQTKLHLMNPSLVE